MQRGEEEELWSRRSMGPHRRPDTWLMERLGDPEAWALEQRPPCEILTQELGGKSKQMPYLQKLEAFQEGADPRPDIGGGKLLRGESGQVPGSPRGQGAGQGQKASQRVAACPA